MKEYIYHITSREAWSTSQGKGFYAAESLSREGFIHCSRNDQVVRVANEFYPAQLGLVLLEMDPERLKAALQMEPGTDKPEELFPHIYGPINLDAVRRVIDFPPGSDGSFSLPDLQEISLRIRPALPGDVSVAVPLIRLSMGAETDWLFGQEPGHPADDVMARLFARKHNRLSFESCWLVEHDRKILGLVLGYPGRDLHKRDLWTGWQLIGIFGLRASRDLARRQVVYGDLVEALPGEFYVSNVAVTPQAQGSGIGARLMAFCDEQAQKMGCGKLSLIVTYDNPARRLYERCGYQVVQSYNIQHPMIAHGSGGYYRMVKELNLPQGKP